MEKAQQGSKVPPFSAQATGGADVESEDYLGAAPALSPGSRRFMKRGPRLARTFAARTSRRRLAGGVIAVVLATSTSAAAQTPNLPDFGTPADTVLNRSQEAQIGRGVMAQLRSAGAVMDDPLVTEYIQNLGAQLAGHANDGDHRFEFFMVDEDGINAFALPGGYIGVNFGLVLASDQESEVAGVLAHEVAHVTQRHIARSIYDNQRNSILSMAAMIVAVLLGAAADANSQAMQGIVSASQAAAIQAQINYTRSNEHEADRIGIRTLSSAGFDPTSMATFFEKLSRQNAVTTERLPSILQTHPVTSERIAEARERARLLPAVQVTDSTSYEVIKARLEVLRAPSEAAAVEIFKKRLEVGRELPGDRYGYALSLSRAGLNDQAQRRFAELIDFYPGVIAFRIGEAEALVGSLQYPAALERYEEAIKLFPRNAPLTLSYVEALIPAGQPEKAHDLLLDLLNNVARPTAEQFRLIARAANAEGDIGNAHHYMSHYYLSIGNLALAFNQIRMALEAPGVNPVDRERFRSEFTDLEGHVQEASRDRPTRGNDGPRPPNP